MNRRQRRAKATDLKSADDITLAHPDRDASQKPAKTLYEIAAEKQAELLPQAERLHSGRPDASHLVSVRVRPDGKIVKEDGTELEGSSDPADAIPPVLDTLLLTLSLSAIHFTLETLTVHQYAQELRFPPIFQRTIFVAFPFLFLLIHLFRGHLIAVPSVSQSARVKSILLRIQQALYVAIANVSGCYLIYLTNDKGYYAVMKNAPSVGTIWVWTVVELGLVGALLGVIGPAIFAWYNGYGV